MAGATLNPYAARERVPGEAPGNVVALPPHHAYAVPDIPESTDPEYDQDDGPDLRVTGGTGELPDSIRVGKREPPGEPHIDNDPVYWQRRTTDRFLRQADETTFESWNVRQARVEIPIIPDQVQEKLHSRRTAIRSPLGYMFTRPWHRPRNVKDALGESAIDHISMADHRRAYEIYGMAPRGTLGVNTYRLDPLPWDRELVAPLAQTTPDTSVRLAGVQAGNRAYRLG
jgi:hypothetical protein